MEKQETSHLKRNVVIVVVIFAIITGVFGGQWYHNERCTQLFKDLQSRGILDHALNFPEIIQEYEDFKFECSDIFSTD
jgi:hypothetical protein